MKDITITIPKKDIYFDVDSATHAFAKVTEGTSLHRADNLESDTDDETAKSMVVRFADRRYAELKRLLSRFMKTGTGTTSTVGITTATTYVYTLNLEDAFQEELTADVGQEMESYIANGVICDWYATLGDAQTQAYAAMLPVILNRIIGLIVSRKMPQRS